MRLHDPTKEQTIKPIGSLVKFASRTGIVVGHWTGDINGGIQTFYLIKLSNDSSGYLTKNKDKDIQDCFISTMLIDVGNIDGP